jgi:fructokinase
MSDLLVFGEALIDLKNKSSLEFEGFVGGSPLNVALSAARLGLKSHLATRVSTDFFGQEILALLEQNNVQTDYLERGEEPSTLAFVKIHRGHPSYSFRFAGTSFLQYQGSKSLPNDLRSVHIGSIFVLFPDLAQRTFARLEGFGGLVHYDLNVRPAIEPNPEIYRATIPPALQKAMWVKCSREDFEFLYPNTAETGFAVSVLETAAVLVVTDGENGARLYRKNQSVLSVPTPKVQVVDTVGAGDTFSGATIHQLLRHGLETKAALENVSAEVLTAVLNIAAKAAAINCTRSGCNPPTLFELQGQS